MALPEVSEHLRAISVLRLSLVASARATASCGLGQEEGGASSRPAPGQVLGGLAVRLKVSAARGHRAVGLAGENAGRAKSPKIRLVGKKQTKKKR